MKKIPLLLALVALAFTSCNTKEKVVYFQDLSATEVIATQSIDYLTFQPGDRMTIVVTSSLTPDAAVSFNLPIVTMQAGSITGQNYSNQMSYYTVEPTE